jgi:hypothetical protein
MRKGFIAVTIAVLALLEIPAIAQEKANAKDNTGASVVRAAKQKPGAHAAHAAARQDARVVHKKKTTKTHAEAAHAEGVYVAELVRCNPVCYTVWTDTIHNVVTTVGKNYALDAYLQTGVTIVGPYMGLISSVSYTTGPAAGDTMASHGGWTEAGGTNAPTYTAPRKTAAWSAASGGSKSLSSALSYAITSSGTIKGCFLVTGTGALSTIDNTAGVLYSAGTFTGGDKVVSSGDTLNVSYTASL